MMPRLPHFKDQALFTFAQLVEYQSRSRFVLLMNLITTADDPDERRLLEVYAETLVTTCSWLPEV